MPKIIHVLCFNDLEKSHWRLMTSIESGMRKNEFIPLNLLSKIANLKVSTSMLMSLLRESLLPLRLVKYEGTGFCLTILGYDFLSIKRFVSKGIIGSFDKFNMIGTGKESDIYVTLSGSMCEKFDIAPLSDIVLKFHRLGRTSFRQVKNKREYNKGNGCSWAYLNRISATREFKTMEVLFKHGFPIPRPIYHDRGAVAMELVSNSIPLFQFNKEVLRNGAAQVLFDQAMKLLVDLACVGLVHGDLNQFNLLVKVNCDVEIITDVVPDLIDNSANESDSEEGKEDEEDSNEEEEDSKEEDINEELEFNVETSEEEEEDNNCAYYNEDVRNFNLVMIDFPQVISRDNWDAKDIYARDRQGLINFFGKFMNLDEVNLPPADISDISRTHFLDAVLKVPGYPKKQQVKGLREELGIEEEIVEEDDVEELHPKFFKKGQRYETTKKTNVNKALRVKKKNEHRLEMKHNPVMM